MCLWAKTSLDEKPTALRNPSFSRCYNIYSWMIKIMIIIALIGAIRDFLQSPYWATNCLQHVRSSGPGAIVCKSRATHRALITCSMSWYVPHDTKGKLSYLIWPRWNCICLSFILLTEPLTDDGGEETRVPGENPWRRGIIRHSLSCSKDSVLQFKLMSVFSMKWNIFRSSLKKSWSGCQRPVKMYPHWRRCCPGKLYCP